jgi:D-glycero-D-manno-heptose 1,7-bisphosphate phosphatase
VRAQRAIRLVLADRDGVLNVDRPDGVQRPQELVLIPGAAAAVRRLNDAGIPLAVVTNQSVVGRGLISDLELEAIHRRLQAELTRAAGARLNLVLSAPDRPDHPSPDRKPAPGMLLKAMRRFGIAAEDTVMIGDDRRDIEAAAAAGCRRVLVRTGKGTAFEAVGIPSSLRPVELCDSFADAIDRLLGSA